ncbi:hypothetical protein [Aeromonas sp. Prich7-2]|uniref:nuclease domain-containing protein n=1 Tax=Aeromonas sp. Prich7-2 TaxID=2823361 RepID=UPI001B3445D1|nr:hypothetical protein [Aeromonas sp. Prich7-2]MBP4058346.1 hypothetical protein [Aeromonas sp. Prich7-2]
MKADFEIKYIEIQWYDKDTITKITESLVSLSLEYSAEIQTFECETTIYPKVKGIQRGQLAIHFFDERNGIAPYIRMPDGRVKNLNKIKDIDTGKVWWIVQELWDIKDKYWRHTGVNTAGTLIYVLNDIDVHIHIGAMDFTRRQLEDYLRSFKDDLWELILDELSSIHANIQKDGISINEHVIENISNMIIHAEKILKTPKIELREIQALKPRKMVKPVSRTFMELTNKANHKVLTSRATNPSYNVAENRYILFALERCYRIIKQVVTLSGNKSQRYADKVNKLKDQHDSFSDTVTVDRNLLVKDFEIMREKCHLQYWQQQLTKSLVAEGVLFDSGNTISNTLFFRTKRFSKDRETNVNDGFFIDVFELENSNLVQRKYDSEYAILSFRNSHAELLACLTLNSTYKITGSGAVNKYGKVLVYTINSLVDIELIDSGALHSIREKYDNEIAMAKQLKQYGWKRKLNARELNEQEKEKKSLLNRIDFYTTNQSLSEYVYRKIEPKLRKIYKVIQEFKALGVTPSSHFPSSMTFVQNPHYQGVHHYYKSLKDLTNLADENLLVNLEEIDSIGLVNMPLLYERWCLLQIIKVLKESFRFVPEDNWKYQLIDAIKTKKNDIAIHFSNADSKRFIKLTYEKTLSNGKRPDFVLDLNWYALNDEQNQVCHTKRFIMDAKFYDEETFNRFGGLMNVISLLRDVKDYSEQHSNPVFLIHPCKKALPEVVTAQSWGKYSYLGEINIGKEEKPNHDYGGILLNPIDKELYNDELQRLLGLLLQYKLEDADVKLSESENDLTISQPFCIRCGSANVKPVVKTSYYINKQGQRVLRTSRSVWMQCMECEQFISYNHCRNTDTRLIKNGLYWTYHSARAIEPFNIKCPHCGDWGGW